MDVRREDHPTEPPMDAAGSVEAPAPMDVSGEDRLRQLIQLRDTVRVELHRQLDDLLALPAQGQVSLFGGSILDSVVVDVMGGMGFQVSVQTRDPKENGHAEEDPSVTEASLQPKPAIEIVR